MKSFPILEKKIWQIVFSRKIFTLLKVLVVDVLLLRGILKESVSRWTIHSFIYLPFFLRFLIGLILLILSVAFPMSPTVAMFLDKNYPPIAFTYDLLGSMCYNWNIWCNDETLSGKTFQNRPSAGQDMIVLVLSERS